MKNRSEHYGDIKLWIEKVINSCETMDHIKTTDRLIINFDKRLERNFVEEYWREYFYDIIQPLKDLLENKRDEIFNKQLEL
jgi:hypothetical protein